MGLNKEHKQDCDVLWIRQTHSLYKVFQYNIVNSVQLILYSR